jgi:hypothetical protein
MVTLRPKESLEMSKITKFCHHYTNSKVEGELGNGTKAMECMKSWDNLHIGLPQVVVTSPVLTVEEGPGPQSKDKIEMSVENEMIELDNM